MHTEDYKARNGIIQKRPVMTVEEADEIMFGENCEGFCLACGEVQSGVEPDAERYTCDCCDAQKVYGFEQLAILGLLKIE